MCNAIINRLHASSTCRLIVYVYSFVYVVFFFLQKRLFNAAKKALSKIPTKNIKAGDKVSLATAIITVIRLVCRICRYYENGLVKRLLVKI